MKTYILQLEPHDDYVSTRDKMAWSKAPRILLVWPRRGRILRRRVDLILLQRQGQSLGAQIALVSRDREVLVQAQEVGIPVFSSVKQAQGTAWKRGRVRRRPLMKPDRIPADPAVLRRQQDEFHPRTSDLDRLPVRLLFFSMGVLAVLTLILFLYPSARVTFSPAYRDQEIKMAVWASPELEQVNTSGGIPAQVVTVEVEGQGEIPAGEMIAVATKLAEGSVRFTNLTDQEVAIPAGTLLRTLSSPPVRFTLDQEITLPGQPGASAEGQATAVIPGTSGNVQAGEIQSVEGLLGGKVTVENPQVFYGGSDEFGRIPSPDDEVKLREKLLADLQQQAAAGLRAKIDPGQEVLLASVRLGEILSEEREPPVGQPSDILRMKIKARFSGWAVSTADIEQGAASGLAANLPEGYREAPGSIQIQQLTQPVLDDGKTARWQISAAHRLQSAWSAGRLAEALRGKTPQEAAAVFKGLVETEGEPAIALSPRWWPRMPYLPFRIEVVQQ